MKEFKSKKTFKCEIAVILFGIVVFTFMLFMVLTGTSEVLDDSIRYFFYNIRNDALTYLMKGITYLGNWQSITLLCIILLIVKSTRITYGIPVSIGAIFVTVLNKTIKHIVERPRPDDIVHLINEGGFSFSSGHSITSMFVFGLLIYLVRSNIDNSKISDVLTVVLAIPMILIGLSRIYLGVHYPTDVVAGWGLGIAVIAAMVILIKSRSH